MNEKANKIPPKYTKNRSKAKHGKKNTKFCIYLISKVKLIREVTEGKGYFSSQSRSQSPHYPSSAEWETLDKGNATLETKLFPSM